MGNEPTRAQSRFFQNETLTSSSFCSLDYAHSNESIIYFTDICKPIETYIYARKRTHVQVIPQHPNAANLRLQTYDKNQWAFFITTARASTLGFFAKVSVPVKTYNSLIKLITVVAFILLIEVMCFTLTIIVDNS